MRSRLAVVAAFAVATAATSLGLAARASAQVVTADERIQRMSQAAFCSGLERGMTAFAKARGLDAVRAALVASHASAALVDEWRTGHGAGYLDVQALLAAGRAAGSGAGEAAREFLPLAPLLVEALGAHGNAVVSFDVEELRFLPNLRRGAHVVLIAREGGSLTEDRARRIVMAARSLGITVSAIWTGEASPASELTLAVAVATGGRAVSLASTRSACAEAL